MNRSKLAPLDARRPDWLPTALAQMRTEGYAIVTGVLPAAFVEEAREGMYRVQRLIIEDIGKDRLDRAGEIGILRFMFKYDPLFFRFLEIPESLAVVDATIGDTSILHTQNGFILPSLPELERGAIFQNRFHRDFPRHLNGFLASVNTMFAIDEFTEANGATTLVPGTHQRDEAPAQEYMNEHGIPVECPAGSMFIFDSTLWHAAGSNRSGADRLAVNHQFTRSYIKQQVDYVRGLGDDVVNGLRPRTQQILGGYTRVVTSLDEYYRPEEQRLYRRGQG
jgi:ectoine hydroxylase-related dioxygenase (phytanoyl-CoA dioxygenase family)